MDAMEIVNLLNAKRFGAANLRHHITVVRNIIRQTEIKITYIHAQGNSVADFLARQGEAERESNFFSHDSAPARAMALTRMDQLGMPSFHLRNQSFNR